MKIHDSKGKLYIICPFLDKIMHLIFLSIEEKRVLTEEEFLELSLHVNSIREIAKFYQKETDCGELNYEEIYQPYNFSAAIKAIKLALSSNTLTLEKIDEILLCYVR